jgi:4-azaleucine resistance transporter AzlC
MQTSPRLAQFGSGIKAELPLLIGVFPFGMIYGVLALEAGIPASAAQAMSAIVFAGSSQFIVTQLVENNTPALVMILTIFIVNLRHALYSASIAPYVSKLSKGWKALLAYLLTDEAYAITITHYNQEGVQPTSHWYFLGAGLALWITWQISTAAGILVGAVIPAAWSLDFTLSLTFIALLMPLIQDKPSLGAALAAGIVAVLGVSMPFKLGLVAAALTGTVVGLLLERGT